MYEHVEDDGDGDGGGDGDGDADDDDDDDDDEGEEEEEDDDTEEEEEEEEEEEQEQEQEEETGHKTAPHDWCKPAQSKCISRFHERHQKSHFRRKFTGKMPRPRLSPERQHTHTLLESLRSRNAYQDFTRATPGYRIFTANFQSPKNQSTL